MKAKDYFNWKSFHYWDFFYLNNLLEEVPQSKLNYFPLRAILLHWYHKYFCFNHFKTKKFMLLIFYNIRNYKFIYVGIFRIPNLNLYWLGPIYLICLCIFYDLLYLSHEVNSLSHLLHLFHFEYFWFLW